MYAYVLNISYTINHWQVTTYQNSMAPTKVNICKYGIGWTKMLQLLLVHQRALREIRWWLKKTFLKANTSEKKKNEEKVLDTLKSMVKHTEL